MVKIQAKVSESYFFFPSSYSPVPELFPETNIVSLSSCQSTAIPHINKHVYFFKQSIVMGI